MKIKPADSVQELQQQIEKILKDTHSPGVSIAIVHKNGPEWVTGLGIADVASKRPVTADTLFRIGSTSKAFASLSILLLTDQGKLSLEDPVVVAAGVKVFLDELFAPRESVSSAHASIMADRSHTPISLKCFAKRISAGTVTLLLAATDCCACMPRRAQHKTIVKIIRNISRTRLIDPISLTCSLVCPREIAPEQIHNQPLALIWCLSAKCDTLSQI